MLCLACLFLPQLWYGFNGIAPCTSDKPGAMTAWGGVGVENFQPQNHQTLSNYLYAWPNYLHWNHSNGGDVATATLVTLCLDGTSACPGDIVTGRNTRCLVPFGGPRHSLQKKARHSNCPSKTIHSQPKELNQNVGATLTWAPPSVRHPRQGSGRATPAGIAPELLASRGGP